MTIYLLISAILFVLGVLTDLRKHPQRRRFYMLLAFLILVIISAMREYYVGSDTLNYVRFFINGRFDVSRYEEGFVWFARLIKRFWDEPSALLLCSSVVCVGGVCIFIYRHSRYPLISILLYIFLQYYFGQMNMMRQYIACSMILMGYSALMNDRKIVSACWLLIAFTFHSVAGIAFLPYAVWLLCKPFVESLTPKRTFLYAVGISAIAFIGYDYIMKISSYIFPEYSSYYSSKWSDANYSASLMNTLVQFTFLFVGSYVFGKKEFDKEERFAALIMVFACVTSTLSMRMEIWTRIASLFGIYTALLWTPLFIHKIKKQNSRMLVSTAVLGMSFIYMLIVLTYRPEWSGVVPYVWRM